MLGGAGNDFAQRAGEGAGVDGRHGGAFGVWGWQCGKDGVGSGNGARAKRGYGGATPCDGLICGKVWAA